MATEQVSPEILRKMRVESPNSSNDRTLTPIDYSSPESTVSTYRKQLTEAEQQVQSESNKFLPLTRQRAFTPRRERSAIQEYTGKLEKQKTQLQTEQQQFETELARTNPELALPEYKIPIYNQIKQQVQSRVDMINKDLNDFNTSSNQPGITASQRLSIGESIARLTAEKNALLDNLSGNVDDVIRKWNTGYASASVQSAVSDVNSRIQDKNIRVAELKKAGIENPFPGGSRIRVVRTAEGTKVYDPGTTSSFLIDENGKLVFNEVFNPADFYRMIDSAAFEGYLLGGNTPDQVKQIKASYADFVDKSNKAKQVIQDFKTQNPEENLVFDKKGNVIAVSSSYFNRSMPIDVYNKEINRIQAVAPIEKFINPTTGKIYDSSQIALKLKNPPPIKA